MSEPPEVQPLEPRRAARGFRWARSAAIAWLLLAIAYDTSAQTSALEGAHRHLNFGGILTVALVVAVIAFVVGYSRGRRRG